ncbi:AMP nucleosidase [Arboricoccus pini]|uniref:AMP nucleosidase n=1 Tax=Arboricoccus pini TaxID=1963835 RepID=A0A212RBZ8_9PROT|nr:AMP nucleosidase [Arboricoccus pini]SNB69742.1 AMP nucleosidase [Arboricoccus pini]
MTLEEFGAFGIRHMTVFDDPEGAVREVERLYEQSMTRLEQAFADMCRGKPPEVMPDACYPFVGVRVGRPELNHDARLSYGVLHDPGLYGATLTRPQLFRDYYKTQLGILMANHAVPVVVGLSRRPIPLPFAIDEISADVPPERVNELQHVFAMPDLSRTDDAIANGTWRRGPDAPSPLALFSAERVDYSLHRLHHYTGTMPEFFQRFVLLTNYQRYIDHFLDYARSEITSGEEYDRLVEPGNVVTCNPRLTSEPSSGHPPASLPQMPAYHLTRPDGRGVTMINIGVGPSNARNITDHVAVLRPHCWLMLGHCAGLRRSQRLGDYVLAHGYVREDKVLDDELPLFAPVPPIAEVQMALQEAMASVTGLHGLDLKTRMRTGTVATVANRNWELRFDESWLRLNQSRAIALDMESATIAANGFRFRVPYGTLLCVSDKPLHGEIKMRGMANTFYRERINQHLQIGLEAVRILRAQGPERLHSRKLRSFDEPAFR